MADGQVVIQVKSNAKDAARDFDRLDRSLDNTEKELKQVDKAADKTDGSIISLKGAAAGLAGALATVELAQFSKGLVDAASDAEETANKFAVVFSSIQSDAENAATALAENFGLASDEAQKFLADTGDLLTGFGFTQEAALDLSVQLNSLAVDLASFTNVEGGTQRATEALTSALFGETEAAKALGIVITQDVVKAKVDALKATGELTNESDNEARAIATLRLAYEQSKNAIGDFARSQESFANQSRIAEANIRDLKVALGEELLPAATGAIGIFNTLSEAIRNAFSQSDTTTIAGATNEVNKLEQASLVLKSRLAEVQAQSAQTWVTRGDIDKYKQQIADVNVQLAFARDNLRQLKEQQLISQDEQNAEKIGGNTPNELDNALFAQEEEQARKKQELIDKEKELADAINNSANASDKFKEKAVESFDFAGSAADNFSRNATRSLFEPWEEGETAADRFKQVALDTIADILAEFIAAELKKQAVALVTAVLTGGTSAGAGFASSFIPSAKGNAFSNGSVTDKFANGGAFTNSIVSSPTTFPMAGGRTGLMGEAGPEAIMPLDRDNSGRLGVQVAQTPVVNNIYNNAPVQVETVSRPNNQNDIYISLVNNALSSSQTSVGVSDALSRTRQSGNYGV